MTTWEQNPGGWWDRIENGTPTGDRYTRSGDRRYQASCTHAMMEPGARCSWCSGRVPDEGDIGGNEIPEDVTPTQGSLL